MSTESQVTVKSHRGVLRTYWPIVLAILLIVLVIVLPWIAEIAPFRNWIIGRALKDPDLSVKTGSASFGYFSVLSLKDIEISSISDDLHVAVENVRCEKSWLRIWLDLPEVGTVYLHRPQVEIVVQNQPDETETEEKAGKRDRPQFKSVVEDASIRVRRQDDPEPVIDLQGLNATVAIVCEEEGQIWVVEPAQLLDREPLTPKLCNDGLQLIAPMLGDALNVSGSVSLEVDKFRVPLGVDKDKAQHVEIEGVVELHDVNAGLKNQVLQSSAGLIAKLINVELPNQIRILNNSRVEFSVRNGRVQHQGLVFVFADLSPDLRIETSGSVGLDETIDLTLSITIPSSLMGEGPFARRFSDRPLALRVQGTIKEPKVALPSGQNWLLELGEALIAPDSSQQDQQLPGELFNALDQLLKERAEKRAENRPTDRSRLFDRMRKRRSSGVETAPD